MCDYCDCRSVPLIDRLGEDHAQLNALASTIRSLALTGKLAEARRRMAHLLAELDVHTRTEEVALFPVLRESGMAEVAATLADEHQTVERLASDAARASDAAWPTIAVELLAVLTAHMHREEYDVFPGAMQLVAPARWDDAHAAAAAAAR